MSTFKACLLSIFLTFGQHSTSLAGIGKNSIPRGFDWLHSSQISSHLQDVYMREENIKRRATHCLDVLERPQRIPQVVVINGKPLKVLRILGQGNEGPVFLVERDGHTYAFKKFLNPDEYDGNVFLLDHFKRHGIPAPEVIERDSLTKAVLLEYVQGVTVANFIDFLKSKNIDPQPLRDLFNDFVKDAVTIPRPEGVYILPLEQQNVLIELKTKNFYVIDPW